MNKYKKFLSSDTSNTPSIYDLSALSYLEGESVAVLDDNQPIKYADIVLTCDYTSSVDYSFTKKTLPQLEIFISVVRNAIEAIKSGYKFEEKKFLPGNQFTNEAVCFYVSEFNVTFRFFSGNNGLMVNSYSIYDDETKTMALGAVETILEAFENAKQYLS
jgi:hypothetical protein